MTSGDTDRHDLHQLLADLYRRLVDVQRRHLAVAAGVDDAWREADDRDVLLARHLVLDVVRHLTGSSPTAHADEQRVERAPRAARLLEGLT